MYVYVPLFICYIASVFVCVLGFVHARHANTVASARAWRDIVFTVCWVVLVDMLEFSASAYTTIFHGRRRGERNLGQARAPTSARHRRISWVVCMFRRGRCRWRGSLWLVYMYSGCCCCCNWVFVAVRHEGEHHHAGTARVEGFCA